ncbi:MAG: hypothetical protein IKX24_05505 [Prevotella sp.]|nr:hypothetical protein [Prevotella sp.]MBR5061584.1 hypothetical protein [Prevotella sp.]
MKRYYCFFSWFIIAIMSFSFASCSNDDDDDKDSLIGVWVSEETLPMYYHEELTGHVKAFFQFMEDGSLIEKDIITEIGSGETYTETSTYGRWEATGNHLKIITSFAEPYDNPKENADETECTYMFKNGKLILSYQDEDTGEIKSITFVRGQMP